MLVAYYSLSHFSSGNASVNRVKLMLIILNTKYLSDFVLITTLPVTVLELTKSFCRVNISLRL
jgi:hypothetical protein